ncbi:MAG: ribosome small subunit-dependent GTPase A [Lachnospiraceae bacterium]|nr:ribosome small subunit-dependent GTPase A [Lachnospiraceae bacterium]
MTGRIIRGVGGFYYIFVEGSGVYECRARGIFRKEKNKPLVGDLVEISVTEEEQKKGSLDQILERRNQLIRPAVANVDQALVVFACTGPVPNLNLLDRFLIYMDRQNIDTLICFNKTDLVDEAEQERLTGIYRSCGCRVLPISVKEGIGLEELQRELEGKTTVVAGPSGVGKSSLTNYLQPEAQMEVGEISRKIERGKQTTRHTQLVWIRRDTYFLDTPGFSSLYLNEVPVSELKEHFPEFRQHADTCFYPDCMHVSEPKCGVKDALAAGEIPESRYESYLQILQELRDQKRY